MVKQVGRSEVLANDNQFLKQFYNFIQRTNYMKIVNMPQNLKDAGQVIKTQIPLITTTSSRVKSDQQVRSESKTVIEEVISGAGSFITQLGKKLISPKKNKQDNRIQKQSIQSIKVIKNEKSRLIQTNSKYDQMMQFKRDKQLIIEDLSESDDNVDVPDTDESEDEDDQRTIQSMQSIAQKRKSLTSNREKQTPNYSIIKSQSPNNRLLGFISQSNIVNSSNNSSQFSKINHRYNQANADNNNQDDLDKLFYGDQKESIIFNNIDDNNQQLISILDKTNNNNSGFYFEDDKGDSRSLSIKSKYTIHNLQNSDTKSPYVKANTIKEDSHFQQSAIKYSNSYNNTNSYKFQQDFSLESSQNNLKQSQKAFHQIQETDREENENDYPSEYESPERKQRKSIGFKILMSRESSFGIVGFQSENLTRNNTKRSDGRLSNVRESELKKQQKGFKKHSYGFQSDSMQHSQTQSVYYPNSKMLQSRPSYKKETSLKRQSNNEYYYRN
ncbi:UNKNOWN [Stylonychia lemnae]|uniref:Uncharacterized protein n=1 Tax=Stylonychia lemnae TaxID=5949 RepID=A0A078A354_STYLE|nr:UNKNOWN [Stylonychia lemnae]|eukprot:CDW76597.1 UNKNOWN [Stylonychia lemnae]